MPAPPQLESTHPNTGSEVASRPSSLIILPGTFAFTLLIGAIAAITPLAIDMSLPAVPAIGQYFHSTPALASLTLSLFVAGFAFSPLVAGPLSDSMGRKPVLIVGLLLFAIAAVCCATAPSIQWLIAFRFLQGIGAGGTSVLTMAIIRDSFTGDRGRAQMSYVTLVMMFAPMIAPSIGSLLLTVGDWRLIYATLSVSGVILLAALLVFFGESRAATDRHPFRLRPLLQNYGTILSNRRITRYIWVNTLISACLFAYVSGSPLLFIDVLKMDTTHYGWLFALVASGLAVGSLLNGRLSMKGIPHDRLLLIGLLGSLTATTLLVIVSFARLESVWLLATLLCVNAFSQSFVYPNATHGILDPVPHLAGLASAILGFGRMLGAAISSALVAALFDNQTAHAMTSVMWAFCVASFAVYWLCIHQKPVNNIAS